MTKNKRTTGQNNEGKKPPLSCWKLKKDGCKKRKDCEYICKGSYCRNLKKNPTSKQKGATHRSNSVPSSSEKKQKGHRSSSKVSNSSTKKQKGAAKSRSRVPSSNISNSSKKKQKDVQNDIVRNILKFVSNEIKPLNAFVLKDHKAAIDNMKKFIMAVLDKENDPTIFPGPNEFSPRIKSGKAGAIMRNRQRKKFHIGPQLTLLGSEIESLMKRAKISVLMVDDFQSLRHSESAKETHKKVLLLNRDFKSVTEMTNGQLVAVSGPVYFSLKRRASTGPFWCVSIPSIDFDDKQDRKIFATGKKVNQKGRTRMCHIWDHALQAFQKANVNCPVVCAMGCEGLVDKSILDVREEWANALATCLANHDYGFKIVVVSFGNSTENFNAFGKSKLNQNGNSGSSAPRVPVALVPFRNMLEIADTIQRSGFYGLKTGILNPSSPEAVRHGYIGSYWQGNREPSSEQLMAVQTTLLLQHVDLNPKLWKESEIQRYKPTLFDSSDDDDDESESVLDVTENRPILSDDEDDDDDDDDNESVFDVTENRPVLSDDDDSSDDDEMESVSDDSG